MYEDNMRKSFKNIISSNIQVEEDFKKTINFNKTIEIEPFMKKVYDNNYRYYFFYKNQKKLNGKDIFYIRKVYDNLRGYCGLGYKLNNKNIGILFNDNSQMTKINNNFEYILYHQEDKANSKIIHIVINLPPKGISLGLENKIKFFWQIIEEFNKNKKKKMKFSPEKNIYSAKKYNIEDDIYLIKYKKKHKAYFFVFSNGKIQVRFFDGVNIIFSFFPKGVIYISNDNKKTINIFPLSHNQNLNEIECEDPIINSRITYAIKEIKK